MSALPNLVKQANLIVDGQGYLGKLENAKLPDLKQKVEEWRGGGMLGDIEVTVGFEKMAMPFKLGGIEPGLFKLWGLQNNAVKAFQVLGHAVAEDTGETMSIDAYIRGKLADVETDEFKPGSQGMSSYEVKIHYYRLRVNDEELIEYDPINLVLKIGGVDQLASMRANLGL